MISELRWPGDPDPDAGIDVRNLEFDEGDMAVHGVLRRTEVPILNVEALDQLYDMRAMGTSLRLHYLGELDARRISGWLMRSDDVAALGRWILARNRGLAAAPPSLPIS